MDNKELEPIEFKPSTSELPKPVLSFNDTTEELIVNLNPVLEIRERAVLEKAIEALENLYQTVSYLDDKHGKATQEVGYNQAIQDAIEAVEKLKEKRL